MSVTTTIGQIIVNSKLPKGLRDYNRVLTKKEIKTLFTRLANEHPDVYKGIAHDLKRVGDMTAFFDGASIRLKDLRSPVATGPLFDVADRKVAHIMSSDQSDAKKEEQAAQVYNEMAGALQKSIVEEGVKQKNTLALYAHSGARGNALQVNSTIGAPVMVTDHADKPILMPLKHSYAEGVDPAEYWAASYGTRKGVISTKFAVADAGFFSKQLSLASSTLVVTEEDCGTSNGVPYKIEDTDAVDALLARPVKQYKKNEIITPAIMSDLKKQGVKEILIRSPMTCEASKGVCRKCAGIRSRGKLAEVGDNIGLESASAIAEPLSQGALNVKHTGGVSSGRQRVFDFPTLKQFLNIPTTFKNKAPVSEVAGTVEKIEKAPQGGHFIFIKGIKHYIYAESTPLVKVGDHVEAGDALSDGLVNPSDIVRLKGVGTGRKYVADTFREIHSQITGGVNRKHYEAMARSLIDHVKLDGTHDVEGQLPDDVVSFSSLAKETTFKDAQEVPVGQALGKYLAKNYIYFTMGTEVTPSMIEELKKHHETKILVTETKPFFEAQMERMEDIPKTTPDWMHKMMSTHLKRNLLDSVHKGLSSNVHGLSWVPGVAVGSEIGKKKGLSGL